MPGTVIPAWPGNDRPWQIDAYASWLKSQDRDYLAVAWPGAGKTRFALRCMHMALESGEADFVVIVVPTIPLRKQWAEDASLFGIHLDYLYTNNQGTPAPGFHGIVVTYSAVFSDAHLYRGLCSGRHGRRVLAVLDEPHHMQDEQGWGPQIRIAFEAAVKRLLLSGTPWRTDGQAIPFVSYDDRGVCVPSYLYGYADALSDEVCRPIFFPTLQGTMTWMQGGETITATFEDEIAQEQRSKRLRTALMPDGDWLHDALKQADDKLTECREGGHTGAGGLIICMDGEHARRVASLVKRVTGKKPVLVLHDEEGSHDRIVDFERGTDRWLVAVRMVSEGVDIKRLRVLLYATNVTTQLFFDQAIGRIIRMIPDLDFQPAFCYLPADGELIVRAGAIMQTVEHFLRQTEERERRELIEPTQQQFFVPLSADNLKRGVTIATNGNLSAEEIALAEVIKERKQWPFPAEMLVEIWREFRSVSHVDVVAADHVESRPAVITKADRRAKLKRANHQAIGRLVHTSGNVVTFRDANWIANAMFGVRKVDELSEEQLADRLDFINAWRRAWADGNGQQFDATGTFRAIVERNAQERRDRVEAGSRPVAAGTV